MHVKRQSCISGVASPLCCVARFIARENKLAGKYDFQSPTVGSDVLRAERWVSKATRTFGEPQAKKLA